MTAPVAQQQSEKIAMTAPVGAQRNPQGGWTIRFFMPSKYTRDTLPEPDNAHVHLTRVPAETVAVLRFSGVADPAAIEARTAELLDILKSNGIQTTGDPLAWFYDPPWTLPFRRRNEVGIVIEESSR
jgi:hypothetical protein